MNRIIAIDVFPLLNQKVGIGHSVAGLLSELPSICLENRIDLVPFLRRFSGNVEKLLQNEVSPVRLRLPRKFEWFISKLGLLERVTGARLFHATDFYVPLRRATPAIATVYDVIYATQPEGMEDQARIKRAMEFFVSQCVRVISCSEYSAKAFCELYGYPMERVAVIGLGVDQKYSPALAPPRSPSARPYFLAVSCNTTRKNTPRLIQAFIRYARSGGAYDLTLAWILPVDLRVAVEDAGLAHRIHAMGKVSEDRLVDLYQHTVCVMFPSLLEGFGLPVLEALACGVPCMTTCRSSLPEVGGDIPIYVDGEDVDEMARVMWAFERGDMAGVASRTRLEGPRRAAQFTWRRCAEQTVETYLSVFAELEGRPWKPLQLERVA
jgi:glycosyltransferase involved in cell wall biosynthesis